MNVSFVTHLRRERAFLPLRMGNRGCRGHARVETVTIRIKLKFLQR